MALSSSLVRTTPFHGVNAGPNPAGATKTSEKSTILKNRIAA